jgi:hypothetical protein
MSSFRGRVCGEVRQAPAAWGGVQAGSDAGLCECVSIPCSHWYVAACPAPAACAPLLGQPFAAAPLLGASWLLPAACSTDWAACCSASGSWLAAAVVRYPGGTAAKPRHCGDTCEAGWEALPPTQAALPLRLQSMPSLYPWLIALLSCCSTSAWYVVRPSNRAACAAAHGLLAVVAAAEHRTRGSVL